MPENDTIKESLGNVKLKALAYESQLLAEQNLFNELDNYYEYERMDCKSSKGRATLSSGWFYDTGCGS